MRIDVLPGPGTAVRTGPLRVAPPAPLGLVPAPLALVPAPLALVPAPLALVPAPLALVPAPLVLVPAPRPGPHRARLPGARRSSG
ncbi:hypothetical protein ACWFNE_18395 [Cellulomonas sp. NPDC055163]